MGREKPPLPDAPELFRLMVEESNQGMCFNDLEGVIRYSNPAHHRMFGYEPPALVGRRLDFVFATDEEKATFWEYFEWLLEERPEPTPYEAVNHRRDGTPFHVRVNWAWARDASGEVCGMVGIIEDDTIRRELGQELQASEARLKRAEELARVGHWEWDIESDSGVGSDQTYRMFGVERGFADENLWAALIELIVPEDRARFTGAVQTSIETKTPFQVEYRVRRPDGELLHIHGLGFPVLDDEGQVVAMRGTVQDTSVFHQAESQQLRLLELDHRVKNNLASIHGLLEITAANAISLESFVDEFGARLVAMSHAHEQLAARRWDSVTLEQLVEGSVRSIVSAPERVRSEGPELSVRGPHAQPMALVLNELALNSIKHGSLSSPTGTVDVRWRLSDSEDEIVVRWVEAHPLTEAEPKRGTGLSIATGLIEDEIGGTLTFTFPASGADHEIRIPR